MTIKVLVIDDSALIRKLLSEIINSHANMKVVGTAPDPLIAREMIKQLNPDVLTLDVEMPRMDGLDFLERLMRLRPTPVIMISSLTEKGSDITFRALELGAVDFITKPKLDISKGMEAYSEEIARKITTASVASIKRIDPSNKGSTRVISTLNKLSSTEKIIAIGSSTGGTEALKACITVMPADCPGILITQHMPGGFTKSFAERLNGLSKIKVTEAIDNERILPGHAYLAPGHLHLTLKRSGANYVTCLLDTEPVNHHKPSVDVLFNSVAHYAGDNAIGVILTGMGKDGAQGMLAMKEAGAYNIAQNEKTCVVYGMPREAVNCGATHAELPLNDITQAVIDHLNSLGTRSFRV